jgi:hypothetical protein
LEQQVFCAYNIHCFPHLMHRLRRLAGSGGCCARRLAQKMQSCGQWLMRWLARQSCLLPPCHSSSLKSSASFLNPTHVHRGRILARIKGTQTIITRAPAEIQSAVS